LTHCILCPAIGNDRVLIARAEKRDVFGRQKRYPANNYITVDVQKASSAAEVDNGGIGGWLMPEEVICLVCIGYGDSLS
jgi:hypothetical protein